jgi:hypothetical protein
MGVESYKKAASAPKRVKKKARPGAPVRQEVHPLPEHQCIIGHGNASVYTLGDAVDENEGRIQNGRDM